MKKGRKRLHEPSEFNKTCVVCGIALEYKESEGWTRNNTRRFCTKEHRQFYFKEHRIGFYSGSRGLTSDF